MKKVNGILIIMLVLAIPELSKAAFGDWFINRTLRIDYIHSGNDKTEIFALDELIQEPTWDRTYTQLIEPFNYGKYLCKVLDSATGELLFQKHYSTLFNEWQTTEEAKKVNRSFSESVVMPYPKKTISVEFYTRNGQNQWEKKLSLFINPASPFISKESKFSCKTISTWYSGEPSKSLDIVIIAEGYRKWDKLKLRHDVQKFTNYLLDCEPFNKEKDKINVWAVLCYSEESGTDIPGENIWKKTILNSGFYTFGSERYLTTSDNKTVRHLASNAPYDQIVILVNTDKYGGGGFYNTYAMVSSGNKLSDFVLTHEFGHALAGLGDEYYTSEVSVQNFYPRDQEPWEPNLTTLVNFDSKWKSMVGKNIPIPTPAESRFGNTIGVFEGGGYEARGVYRPMMDCSMKSTRYNDFCPVCKKAIIDMIEFYTH